MKYKYIKNEGGFNFSKLENFIVNVEFSVNKTSFFYDTIDKLIENKGFYLELFDNIFYLKTCMDSEIVVICKIEKKDKYFITDFEGNDFRNFLKPIIGHRALLLKYSNKIIEQRIRLINKIDKRKIDFLQTKVFDVFNKIIFDFIVSENGDFEDFSEFKTESSFYSFLEQNSPDYFGKNFNLKNDFAISLSKKFYYETVQSFLLSFYNAILFYKKGIIEEIDSEFVHNFRVTIRRLSSFLDENRTFLKPEKKEIISELSKIQKITNIVRDLDVIIEKQSQYSVFFDNKDEYFDFLNYAKNMRLSGFVDIKRKINSLEFNEFMASFLEFINSLSKIKSDELFYDKIYPLVLEKINYFTNLDTKILAQFQGKELHKFRIKIKKLRYSFEFYAQFWNENVNFKNVLNDFKAYQDLLGHYTDLIFLEKIILQFNSESIDTLKFISLKKESIRKEIFMNYDDFKAEILKIIV